MYDISYDLYKQSLEDVTTDSTHIQVARSHFSYYERLSEIMTLFAYVQFASYIFLPTRSHNYHAVVIHNATNQIFCMPFSTGRHAQVILHAGTCRDKLMQLQKGSRDLPVEAIKALCHSHFLIGQSYLGEGLNIDAEKAFLLATNVMQLCCRLVGGAADVQLQIKIANDLGKCVSTAIPHCSILIF